MTLKVLIFFPHNPYPPKSGAHKRCLEMINGFRELGCRITLTSQEKFSDWDISSIQSLEASFVDKVLIYETTFLDRKFLGLIGRFHTLTKTKPSLTSYLYTPPGMRKWFAKIIKDVSPDLIMMNYAHWDNLIAHNTLKKIPRIIETHDLLNLNSQMQEILSPYLINSLIKKEKLEDDILDENFFNKLALQNSKEEFRIYEQYDWTIAISLEEAKIIRQNTEKTKVVFIPVTQQPSNIINSYTGAAIFPIGPNPFNIQGYLYFIKKVLPKILAVEPSFMLEVTGSFWNNIVLEPCVGVEIKGFVPDLEAVYQQSRFLVCPVFGGTGQQVKVVEAMAHGLPVVALRQAAERSPLKHGVNGFVADNADEFAHYCTLLWQQENLCRQLGKAARDTIASEFSRESLLLGISQIL